MNNKPSKDILFNPFPMLDWSAGKQVDSVDKLIDYVANEAQMAITWYLNRKNVKKRCAQTIRILVILATTVSGLVPLLAEILDAGHRISPIWSSVALVLAAALVGLDYFFGCSTAWMRFISTEVKLRQALHTFYMDCEIQRSTWHGQNPENAQITKIVERCKTFIEQVNLILENEINTWMSEFQSVLKAVDSETKGVKKE